ncbi:MAG: hypothetical protein HOB07_02715 [Chloroflexi bacterium]|nr:hypothetical protein [Chloroflexota bacterium]
MFAIKPHVIEVESSHDVDDLWGREGQLKAISFPTFFEGCDDSVGLVHRATPDEGLKTVISP